MSFRLRQIKLFLAVIILLSLAFVSRTILAGGIGLFQYTGKVMIQDNNLDQNRIGIQSTLTNVTIKNNVITDSDWYGMRMTGEGTAGDRGKFTLQNNVVLSAGRSGIQVRDADSLVFEGNTVGLSGSQKYSVVVGGDTLYNASGIQLSVTNTSVTTSFVDGFSNNTIYSNWYAGVSFYGVPGIIGPNNTIRNNGQDSGGIGGNNSGCGVVSYSGPGFAGVNVRNLSAGNVVSIQNGASGLIVDNLVSSALKSPNSDGKVFLNGKEVMSYLGPGGYGLLLSSADNGTDINGQTFANNKSFGIIINGAVGVTIRNCWIYSNFTASNQYGPGPSPLGGGILLANQASAYIYSNYIYDNGYQVSSVGAGQNAGVVVRCSGLNYSSIYNNSIYNNRNDGVEIIYVGVESGRYGPTVSNNWIFNNNRGGIDLHPGIGNTVPIRNNSIYNNGYSGISMSLANVEITGNLLTNNGIASSNTYDSDYQGYFASGIQLMGVTIANGDLVSNTIISNWFAGIAVLDGQGTIGNYSGGGDNYIHSNGNDSSSASSVCTGVGGTGFGGISATMLTTGNLRVTFENASNLGDNVDKDVQHKPGSSYSLYKNDTVVNSTFWGPSQTVLYISENNKNLNCAGGGDYGLTEITGGDVWGVVVMGATGVTIQNCNIYNNCSNSGVCSIGSTADGQKPGGGVLIAAGAEVYMNGNSVYNNGYRTFNADKGGSMGVALRCADGNTSLLNNTIENNFNDGLNLYDSEGIIGLSGNSNIIRNNGRHGIGIRSLEGGSAVTPVIAFNEISSNTAFGIGCYSLSNTAVTISNNLIYSNHSVNALGFADEDIGGGIGFYRLTNTASIDGNTIRNNPGVKFGGVGATASNGTLSLTNNTIVNNSGSDSNAAGGIGLIDTGSSFVLYVAGNIITANNGSVAGGIGGTLGNADSIVIADNEIGNHSADAGISFSRFTLGNSISIINNNENGGIHDNQYGIRLEYNTLGNIYIGDSNIVSGSGTAGIQARNNSAGITIDNNTSLDKLGAYSGWCSTSGGSGFTSNSGPILIVNNNTINGYGLTASYNTGGISFSGNEYIDRIELCENNGDITITDNTKIDRMIGQSNTGTTWLVDNNNDIGIRALGWNNINLSVTNNPLVKINTSAGWGWSNSYGGFNVYVSGNTRIEGVVWQWHVDQIVWEGNPVIDLSGMYFRSGIAGVVNIFNNPDMSISDFSLSNKTVSIANNTINAGTFSLQNSAVSIDNNSISGSSLNILNPSDLDILNNTASAPIYIKYGGAPSPVVSIYNNPELSGGVSINNGGYPVIPGITGNTFKNASAFGVSVTLGGASIANNLFYSNAGGIRIDGATSQVTVAGNMVYSNINTSDGAGGIGFRNLSGSAFIDNNTVRNNSGEYAGGVGVSLSNGTISITDNLITSNSASGGPAGLGLNDFGGDAYIYSNTITYNTIATSTWFPGGIGVISPEAGSLVTIDNNVIASNVSPTDSEVGGIALTGTVGNIGSLNNVYITSNRISNHRFGATANQGAVAFRWLSFSNMYIRNNRKDGLGMSGNGGGIRFHSLSAGVKVSIVNNLIQDNVSPGSSGGGAVEFKNSNYIDLVMNDNIFSNCTWSDSSGGKAVIAFQNSDLYSSNSIEIERNRINASNVHGMQFTAMNGASGGHVAKISMADNTIINMAEDKRAIEFMANNTGDIGVDIVNNESLEGGIGLQDNMLYYLNITDNTNIFSGQKGGAGSNYSGIAVRNGIAGLRGDSPANPVPVIISNNNITDSRHNGMMLQPGASVNWDISITNNTIKDNLRSGVSLSLANAVTIQNNTIISNGLDDYVAYGYYDASGIRIKDGEFDVVSGNTIRNHPFAGVTAFSSPGLIGDNIINSNGTTVNGTFVCEGVGGNGRGGISVRDLGSGEVLSIENYNLAYNEISSVQHKPGSLGDVYYNGSPVSPGTYWDSGDVGLYITASNFSTNCNGGEITGGAIWGVAVMGVFDNITIENCRIHDNALGINTAGPNGETVGGGVLIAGGADVYLEGNSIYNNGYAAQLDGIGGYVGVALRCAGPGTTLVNNTIENNANDGIAVSDSAGYIGLSGKENTIRNNGRHGVGFSSLDQGGSNIPVLAYNRIYSNTRFGVGAYSIANITPEIRDNSIYNNRQSGIGILYATSSFTIQDNFILSNGLDDYYSNGEYYASGIQLRDTTVPAGGITGNTIRNSLFAGLQFYNVGGTIGPNNVLKFNGNSDAPGLCPGAQAGPRGAINGRDLGTGVILSIGNNTVTGNYPDWPKLRPGSCDGSEGEFWYEDSGVWSRIPCGGTILDPSTAGIYITPDTLVNNLGVGYVSYPSGRTVINCNNGTLRDDGSQYAIGVAVMGLMNNVTVQNCEIRDFGTVANGIGTNGQAVGAGILVAGLADVYIDSNDIHDNGGTAAGMDDMTSGYAGVILRCAGTGSTLVNNSIHDQANDGVAVYDGGGQIGLSGQPNDIDSNGRFGIGSLSLVNNLRVGYNSITNNDDGMGGDRLIGSNFSIYNNYFYWNVNDSGNWRDFGVGFTMFNGDVTVENNYFNQNKRGVAFQQMKGGYLLIKGNTIVNTLSSLARAKQGIEFERAFYDNGVYSNSWAAATGLSITIENNSVNNYAAGMKARFIPFTLPNVNLYIAGNTFTNHKNSGLNMQSVYNMNIYSNYFDGNNWNAGGNSDHSALRFRYVYDGGNITITDNTITNNDKGGLGFATCDNANISIANNYISGNSSRSDLSDLGGLRFKNIDNSTISIVNNNISNNLQDGLQFKWTVGSDIVIDGGSITYNSEDGVSFKENTGMDLTIDGLTITYNTIRGIQFQDNILGTALGATSYITVSNNTVNYNGDGIQFRENYDMDLILFAFNDISYNNDTGIWILDTENVRLEGNTILDNPNIGLRFRQCSPTIGPPADDYIFSSNASAPKRYYMSKATSPTVGIFDTSMGYCETDASCRGWWAQQFLNEEPRLNTIRYGDSWGVQARGVPNDAAAAIDNTTYTEWRTAASEAPHTHNVTYNLGATYTVTDVRIYAKAEALNWNVYVGGASVGSLAAGGSITPNWYTLSSLSTGGSTIKLESAGGADGRIYRDLYEIQYKRSGDSTWYNPSSVSGYCSREDDDEDGAASNAIDNDESKEWRTHPGDRAPWNPDDPSPYDHWITFNLSGTPTVTAVRIKTSGDNTRTWKVYVTSTLNTDPNPVLASTTVLLSHGLAASGWVVGDEGSGSDYWDSVSFSGKSGRYIRLEATGGPITDGQFLEFDYYSGGSWQTPASVKIYCSQGRSFTQKPIFMGGMYRGNVSTQFGFQSSNMEAYLYATYVGGGAETVSALDNAKVWWVNSSSHGNNTLQTKDGAIIYMMNRGFVNQKLRTDEGQIWVIDHNYFSYTGCTLNCFGGDACGDTCSLAAGSGPIYMIDSNKTADSPWLGVAFSLSVVAEGNNEIGGIMTCNAAITLIDGNWVKDGNSRPDWCPISVSGDPNCNEIYMRGHPGGCYATLCFDGCY